MAKIIVDSKYCKGCGLCVNACPKKILELDPNVISEKGYHPARCIDESQCVGCMSCMTMCPDIAIQVVK